MRDFLASPWQEAVTYLLDCRKALGIEVGDDHIVVLVALEGAAQHKKDHAYCGPEHYTDFTNACRLHLKRHGGRLLSLDQDGRVDYLTFGWFADARCVIAAMAAIHRFFFKQNLKDRGVAWVHEKHPVGAIGRSEYAAFRLLQMAKSDETVVDPVVWDKLPHEFQTLAAATGIVAADFEKSKRDIETQVQEHMLDLARECRVQKRIQAAPAMDLVGSAS